MLYYQDEEEFETTWKQIVDEYNITEKINWFILMYTLRDKWDTGFSNNKFSAGLKATSRSEGTNSALKKFGGATSSLYDCVIAFEKVQESWRLDDKEKDTRCQEYSSG